MMKVWQPSNDEIKKTENWGIWRKESSVFDWFYEEPEMCYILKGEAVVKDCSGNSISFKAGDMVKFEQGLKCTWTIKKDLEKRYYFG
jgi:uncharacterized protein